MKLLSSCRIPLYPFQKESVQLALNFLTSCPTNSAYCANEAGTGKTPVAIAVSQCLEEYPILILCPAVMRLTWEAEIYKFSRPGCPRVKVISNSKDTDFSTYDYVITSYDTAIRSPVSAALAKTKWGLMICDEAHYLRNYSAKRSKFVFKTLFPVSRYKLFLSGTPFVRQVMDLYYPFKHIYPHRLFQNQETFGDSFCESRFSPFGYSHKEYYGLKNAEALSSIMRKNFYFRFRKKDVLKELPSKTWQTILLDERYKHDSKKAILFQDEQKLLQSVIDGKPLPPAEQALASTVRRLQGEAKVPAVIEFCEDLLERENPVVLFAYHTNVIASLAEGLKKFKPLIIQGETTPKERFARVAAFQEGKSNLFIGQIVAAGTGITLTRASIAVFAELSWLPAEVSQASDRIHRVTQTSACTCYYLCVKDSLDERIASVIVRRASESKAVLDGGDGGS